MGKKAIKSEYWLNCTRFLRAQMTSGAFCFLVQALVTESELDVQK